eukprot:3043323-Prymnesium_polylepis.1
MPDRAAPRQAVKMRHRSAPRGEGAAARARGTQHARGRGCRCDQLIAILTGSQKAHRKVVSAQK